MDVAGLIEHYGYAALFVATILEGETVLILAGFAAYQGHMELHWVFLVAMLGGFLGDQFYFWMGKRHGGWVLSNFPKLIPAFERANVLIERYHELLIVGIRFMYGLRIVGPIALGMSSVPGWRFVRFNALGAMLWAILIGGVGYLFGKTVALFLNDMDRIEAVLLGVIVLAGVIVWSWRRWKFRRKYSS